MLDDFIGSGNTFINFYNKNLKIIIEKQIDVYYCVLTGLKQGINKIKEETKIPVICAHKFDESDMILKGSMFSENDKIKIQNLIEKYSKRLPKNFLFGYENSELLVVFESNIPNNSISLLWASEAWKPLKPRL